MARKPPVYIPPKCFIHYDKKTGEIFSASNERNKSYSAIEIGVFQNFTNNFTFLVKK
jgi:hypothetical protein